MLTTILTWLPKDKLIAAMLAIAWKIAGDIGERIADLAADAEARFGAGEGGSKRDWVMGRLHTEGAWARSYLATLPSWVSAAVFAAIVADTKSRLA